MLTDTQKKKARNELAMLHGDPPHNTWSNICYGDGYFANSLVQRYGMSISQLEKESGYKKAKKKLRKAQKKYEKFAEEALK